MTPSQRSLTVLAFTLAAAAVASSTFASEIPGTSDVLARRGAAEVTEAEVDTRMREIPEQQRAGFIDSVERIDSMINQLLLVEQMASEARKLKLDRTDAFRSARELSEKRELALAYQEYTFNHAPAFDAETLAAEAYAASPKSFSIGDAVDLRHILIKTACRSPEAARALAEQLRERALKGESVADLARKYSEDDSSAAEGGVFLDVTRGKTVKPFEDAAFAMSSSGELSPVVETPYGYHVIEMIEHRVGRPAEFDEIKEGLIAQMRQRHQSRYLQDQSDRLLNLPLAGNPTRLQALRTRYGNAEIVEDAARNQKLPAPLMQPRKSAIEKAEESLTPRG